MTATEDKRRPKLEVCLEQMTDVVNKLAEKSMAFQQMKRLASDLATAPESVNLDEFQVTLTIPGTDYQVPAAGGVEAAQALTYVEAGMDTIGREILQLWGRASEIANDASEHCNTAADRAEQSG